MDNTAILKKTNFYDNEVYTNKKSNLVYIKETSENIYLNQDYVVKFYDSFDKFAENIAKKHKLNQTDVINKLEEIIFKSSEKRENLQEFYLKEKQFVENLKNLESKVIIVFPSSYLCKERLVYPLKEYLKHSKYLKKIDLLYKKMKNVFSEKPYLLLFPHTQIFEYGEELNLENNVKEYVFYTFLIRKIKPTYDEKISEIINQEILSAKYGYLIKTLREKNHVSVYYSNDKIFEKIMKEAENYSKMELIK